jgi:GT2 family glycosyltransferase
VDVPEYLLKNYYTFKCKVICKFMDTTSVIIPAHNEENTINECLHAVIGQKGVGEIIVIDDCSKDKTAAILKSYGNRITVIRNPTNLGLSKTLNIGLNAAKYSYVCTLHADCIVPKNWFTEQMKYFSKDVATVTSKIMLPKRDWGGFTFWNKIFSSKFLMPKKIICENKCDIYRTNLLKKLGFFSPDFRVAGEDFDLFCRIRKLGYRVVCTDQIVSHKMGSHQRGFWKYFKKEFQYGEARGAIFRKYRYLILFNPFAFVLFPDPRLVVALPLVIILRTLVHFVSFWKGLLTGKQTA